jgi:hypothetical protein
MRQLPLVAVSREEMMLLGATERKRCRLPAAQFSRTMINRLRADFTESKPPPRRMQQEVFSANRPTDYAYILLRACVMIFKGEGFSAIHEVENAEKERSVTE